MELKKVSVPDTDILTPKNPTLEEGLRVSDIQTNKVRNSNRRIEKQ